MGALEHPFKYARVERRNSSFPHLDGRVGFIKNFLRNILDKEEGGGNAKHNEGHRCHGGIVCTLNEPDSFCERFISCDCF